MRRQPFSGFLVLISAVFVVSLAPARAQETAAVQRGSAKFQYACAPCHAAGPGDDGRALLPGTAALQMKYNGSMPAVLEQRTDLTADVLKSFLRHGSWSMPPFRKTEVTDAEIADIAAYLARSSKASSLGR